MSLRKNYNRLVIATANLTTLFQKFDNMDWAENWKFIVLYNGEIGAEAA